MKANANVVANYVSQIYTAIIGFAFVPICIRFLGAEAFGLIAIFAIVQNSAALLDMGLRPTMAREMARFGAGARDVQSARDLLRSAEVLTAAVALLVAAGIWGMSAWLSTRWLSSHGIAPGTIAHALSGMGVICALRFIENVYVGSIIGLQRQVTQCVIACSLMTARAAGAVLVLSLVSPTIEAFILWQVLVSLISIPAYAQTVYQAIPAAARRGKFSSQAIAGVWMFSGGVAAHTVLAFLLTQSDKIILSARLPLKAFSYYAIASALSNALNMLAIPISAAFYPLFAELSARGDMERLRAAYHQAAQLTAVLTASAAITLAVFADTALRAWTADAGVTMYGAPILRILALGALLNGFMGIPYQLQLAAGWTSLTAKLNGILVCVMIPAQLLVIPRYGTIGAAWIWVALNLGNMIFNINLMHRRLLPGEKWRWYGQDVLVPTMAGGLTALACRAVAPQPVSLIGGAVVLIAAFVLVALTCALVCSSTRSRLRQVTNLALQRRFS